MPGLKEALPLLVIIVVLFVRGDRLPTRGARARGTASLCSDPHHRRREGRHLRGRRGRGPAPRRSLVEVGRDQLARRCGALPVARRADRLRRTDLAGAAGVRGDRWLRGVEARHASRDRLPDRATSRCTRSDGRRPDRCGTRAARAGRESRDRHLRGRGGRGEPAVQELGAVGWPRRRTGRTAPVPRHQVRAERRRSVR